MIRVDPLTTDAAHHATIAVAGAGPVGMCLAIDASLRGLDVVVIEPRQMNDPPGAKCNTVAARTMEVFRRFGIADAVRNSGLPDEFPTDVIYCTSVAGEEITRISQPSRAERQLDGWPDSGWRTPEPVVRASQIYLEPVLSEKMRSLPNVTLLNGTTVEAFEQSEQGVKVQCRDSTGEPVVVTAEFLAGCDGGRSTVRRAMGATLVGDTELGRTRTSLIRAPGIRDLFRDRRPVWMSWVLNPKANGTVIAIDGSELWLVHRAMPEASTDWDDLDFDQSIRDVLGVGSDFQYEVVSHEDWIGRRMVADRMRDGRVFLAGDAAHLWIPLAGYGMNAGITDAMTLSWLISSVVAGWGDCAILDCYEAERLPITDQASRSAMGIALANAAKARPLLADSNMWSPGPEGEAARARLAPVLREVNIDQFVPEGLNFGYFYDGSPIISYDGAEAPAYSMGSVTPSTVPGCRMPHFMVDDHPILDLLGPDYTLVRFEESVDAEPLVLAAKRSGMPLKVVDCPRPTNPPVFEHALLVVRSDQHVAWRGNEVPQDPDRLVHRLRGAISELGG